MKLSAFHVPSGASEWIGYAMRAWLASLLALYLAFALQMDAPYWAFITVWIVVQPTVGMQLSKSLYRVLGTVLGTVFGVIIVAWFAQTPMLFLLALSLLLGVVTTLANLSENFRSYAFALTGYTAGIIATGAITKAEQVFFIAAARMSCILLGIVCAGLTGALFAPHNSVRDARRKLLSILKDAARRAAFPSNVDEEARAQLGLRLLNEITSANSLVEYASAESGTFRLQATNARSLLAHAIGMITARRAIEPHVNDGLESWSDQLLGAYESAMALFGKVPEALEQGEVDHLIVSAREIRDQLLRIRPEETSLSRLQMVVERTVLDRLDDLLGHAENAFEDWRCIVRDVRRVKRVAALNFHRDHRAALIAGFRAFLAVYGAGLFWMLSAWSYGGTALLIVTVVMSLFSSTPQPARATGAFFVSCLVASACSVVFKFLILAKIGGFEVFVIAFALIAIPLGVAMVYPKTAPMVNSFALIFMAVMSPTNPMTFNLADSLNSAIAFNVGAVFGVLAYLLIFPANPRATRRYVFYRARRGLELLAAARAVPTHVSWETRMYDRANRLRNAQKPARMPLDQGTEAALGALALGNELIRLKALVAGTISVELRTAILKVLHTFVRFRPRPQFAAKEVRGQLDQISHLDPGAEQRERQVWVRVQGALTEIDRCLVANPMLWGTEKAV